MLRALDGYSYYHKLAQTRALLSTQLYWQLIVPCCACGTLFSARFDVKVFVRSC